jgi:wyosine [tRNA(Phe)-imidazoG37] synthetase (radical SAM superfamily)
LRIDRHPRLYRENRYVYPVLSRRAHGISIGINLNPDKICNFDCIYCQVDREVAPVVKDVDEARLFDELRDTLRQVKSGALFERDEFKALGPAEREIRDVTFAGDGEPPSYPNFTGVVRETIRIKKEEGFERLPINLLTNATLIDRPRVQEGMRLIDADGGAHWLKLDAGTEEYYKLVERTTIPFARVLANLAAAARERPVVIQSLFLRIRGEAPSAAEIDAWCGRLEAILKEGGAIRLVQVYTVARPPAESYVTPLSDQEVDAIAAEARRRLPGIAVESFYSGRF